MNISVTGAFAVIMLAGSACSSNGPTPVGYPMSLIYERVYPADTAVTRPTVMALFIPRPGDSQQRSEARGCVLQPEGSNRFNCALANIYEIPLGLDVAVEVSDEALLDREIKSVATRVYVNGNVVTRVERFANGAEVGRFRVNARGEVQ